MNPGTEDSMWLVVNLIIMSGHVKKLLQEILRHEPGVTAIPRMLFMYVHAYTTVSKRQFKAVYSSATLCLSQDDSTHKDNYCKAADTFKSSQSLFHGNWFVHPYL